MTSLIAPVIPSKVTVRRDKTAQLRRLPLTTVRRPPRVQAHYALRPIDSQGRINDRDMVARLGWEPGQRLQWRIQRDIALITSDDTGTAHITPSGYLRLPARFRHATSTVTGDRILFVIPANSRHLIAVPPVVVDSVLTTYLSEALENRGQP